MCTQVHEIGGDKLIAVTMPTRTGADAPPEAHRAEKPQAIGCGERLRAEIRIAAIRCGCGICRLAAAGLERWE